MKIRLFCPFCIIPAIFVFPLTSRKWCYSYSISSTAFTIYSFIYLSLYFHFFFSFNKESTILELSLLCDFCIFFYQWQNITYLFFFTIGKVIKFFIFSFLVLFFELFALFHYLLAYHVFHFFFCCPLL